MRRIDNAKISGKRRSLSRCLPLAFFLGRHAERWKLSDDAAIELASNPFIEETTGLLAQISNRFRHEDDELYPLVDQIRTSGEMPLDSITEPDGVTRSAG